MGVLVAVVTELGLSWQVSAKQAVGVLDGAALPGRMGIAKKALHGKILLELLMASELGVESRSLAFIAMPNPEMVGMRLEIGPGFVVPVIKLQI